MNRALSEEALNDALDKMDLLALRAEVYQQRMRAEQAEHMVGVLSKGLEKDAADTERFVSMIKHINQNNVHAIEWLVKAMEAHRDLLALTSNEGISAHICRRTEANLTMWLSMFDSMFDQKTPSQQKQ